MTPSEERARLGTPASHSAVAPESRSSVDHGVGCVTCGDTAAWMRVLEVDTARELAVCADEGGRRHTVDTGVAGAIASGDRLLVHAGAALLKEPA
jgi:hypothetical protein